MHGFLHKRHLGWPWILKQAHVVENSQSIDRCAPVDREHFLPKYKLRQNLNYMRKKTHAKTSLFLPVMAALNEAPALTFANLSKKSRRGVGVY